MLVDKVKAWIWMDSRLFVLNLKHSYAASIDIKKLHQSND